MRSAICGGISLRIDVKKWKNKYLRWVFPMILLLYPLRHIRYGAEWWDTGYNYANFVYMDRMDPMWLFGTWLGTALGNLFTKLPFGGQMIGLNLYTGLTVSVLAVGGYFFFVRKVGVPAWIAFWGELLAVSFCWCPTALLYNYLTYVLFGAGCVLLYFALCGESSAGKQRLYFVLAGVCLGLNVFTRLPNLAEAGMITAVWAIGIIRREKPGRLAGQTLVCLAGYVLGLAAGFSLIAVKYGPKSYFDGIVRLLNMPSEASDYSLYSMIYGQITGYRSNLFWLGCLLVFILVLTLVYSLLPAKWERVKSVLCVPAVAGCFGFLYHMKMYNLQYRTTMSMIQWASLLLTMTILMGIAVILGRKFSEKEKLLNGMGILVILITPLGSNNGLFSAVNNLFFVAPYTLWMLVRLIKVLSGKPSRITSNTALKRLRLRISSVPLRITLAGVLLAITVQGTLCGFFYVFTEAAGGENLHTSVENSAILKGILTSPDRARILEEISGYVQEQGLTGQDVILYGYIPAMSYYLEMPFAITAWPDLRSYHYSVMQEDLEKIAQEIEQQDRICPVLLLERAPGLYLTQDRECFLAAGYTEAKYEELAADEKLTLIGDFAERFGYRVTFENEKFILLLAEGRQEGGV